MIASQFLVPVFRESTTLNVLQSDIHGIKHWFRVWVYAQELAEKTPEVDMEVVAMFALFHDSMRNNDSDDPDHGWRGWELWSQLQSKVKSPPLEDTQQILFHVACHHHNSGFINNNPTVGVCWDADRLDLPRVGIEPDPKFMSTPRGIELTSRKNHRI